MKKFVEGTALKSFATHIDIKSASGDCFVVPVSRILVSNSRIPTVRIIGAGSFDIEDEEYRRIIKILLGE